MIPAEEPIPIHTGWNWIGFQLQAPLSVQEALESISPVEGDYLKNQFNSATYYEGYGWFGELIEMHPVAGYMLKTSHPASLVYPANME